MSKGEYVSGRGKASRRLDQYQEVFRSPMVGTFNIKTDTSLEQYRPAIIDKGGAHRYWLVRINDRYGWAIRWTGSKMKPTNWEVLTREPLPEEFKAGELDLQVLERWAPETIKEWAKGIDWFQTFPWSPRRADSGLVWGAVARAAGTMAGRTLLDIGCNYGYHTIAAARAGAIAIGYDKNPNVLRVARTINESIEMQDARFAREDPGGTFDLILYLSVHHQFDPAYAALRPKIEELAARARTMLFVELIVPPLAGKLDTAAIDGIAGGKVLENYKHSVRGYRRIYGIPGKAA